CLDQVPGHRHTPRSILPQIKIGPRKGFRREARYAKVLHETRIIAFKLLPEQLEYLVQQARVSMLTQQVEPCGSEDQQELFRDRIEKIGIRHDALARCHDDAELFLGRGLENEPVAVLDKPAISLCKRHRGIYRAEGRTEDQCGAIYAQLQILDRVGGPIKTVQRLRSVELCEMASG